MDVESNSALANLLSLGLSIPGKLTDAALMAQVQYDVLDVRWNVEHALVLWRARALSSISRDLTLGILCPSARYCRTRSRLHLRRPSSLPQRMWTCTAS